MVPSAASPQSTPHAPPFVSFCIATYRRPERLSRTLHAIRAQTCLEFEVIVSDNDPEGSAGPVVESFSDPRFRYFRNEENVGMVKNFNRALSHARGEYVVMITDDDPPYPNLLETLLGLKRDCPGYGAYYGACNVFEEDALVAHRYGHRVGMNSCLAPVPEGTVRQFSAEAFPQAFFSNRIFPYVLWSTGIVRREILQQTGGMPDYGSAFLTDFAFVAAVGSHSGMATVNVALGHQTVHLGNFGRAEFRELPVALQGSHRYLETQLSHRPDWPIVRTQMEIFFGHWIIAHGLFLYRHMVEDRGQRRELQDTMRNILRIAYMRRFRSRYYARVYLPVGVAALLRPLVRFARSAKRRLRSASAT
jgi:glycosyltransferase involved in cell wall biosynthesis